MTCYANELWAQVENDPAGLLTVPSINLNDLFHQAESLTQHHTAHTGARSVDILHVTMAQTLASEEMVTFDLRQATLANRVGLRVAVL